MNKPIFSRFWMMKKPYHITSTICMIRKNQRKSRKTQSLQKFMDSNAEMEKYLSIKINAQMQMKFTS
jgi:hypothetical protein